MDREVALEALSVLCNGKVRCSSARCHPSGAQHQLNINNLVCSVLNGDECSPASQCIFTSVKCLLQSSDIGRKDVSVQVGLDAFSGQDHIIDVDEFFAPEYDYDFTNLKQTETYWRGGEKYERPCGWFRFGLKVLNKYDGNTWLGTSWRSTQSCPGEWPVSYHGTSKKGAEGIIEGHYEPGPGKVYGRGIYSTPDIDEAAWYAKTFISKKTGKKYKVVLQNRINPEYRRKYNNDKYWLIPIPAGTSDEKEEQLVERAIRPYGLLVKEV